MAKYICTDSKDKDIPLGTIIEAEPIGNGYLRLTKKFPIQNIGYRKGETIPIMGILWYWEPVADEVSSKVLLDRLLNKAAELSSAAVQNSYDYSNLIHEYEELKATILKKMKD